MTVGPCVYVAVSVCRSIRSLYRRIELGQFGLFESILIDTNLFNFMGSYLNPACNIKDGTIVLLVQIEKIT